MSAKRLFEPQPGEKIAFALHRHPFTFLKHVLMFLLMAALPVFVAFLGAGESFMELQNMLAKVGLVLLGVIYYLAIWLFFFTQFVDYYLDLSIVTDSRIIDIDQEGLFSRTISELNLARVQDVKSEIKGIFPTMVNYGTVVVQTAGEQEHFVFEQVSRPHVVRQRILELAHADRQHEAKELLAAGTDSI